MCYPCSQCGYCGKPEVNVTVRCLGCGAPLEEGKRVCPECGMRYPLPPGEHELMPKPSC